MERFRYILWLEIEIDTDMLLPVLLNRTKYLSNERDIHFLFIEILSKLRDLFPMEIKFSKKLPFSKEEKRKEVKMVSFNLVLWIFVTQIFFVIHKSPNFIFI